MTDGSSLGIATISIRLSGTGNPLHFVRSGAERASGKRRYSCSMVHLGEASMRDVFIVDAIRTPIGRGKADGALHNVHPVDLLAQTLNALVEHAGVDKRE